MSAGIGGKDGSWWEPSDTNLSFVGKLEMKKGRPRLTIKAAEYGQGSIHMLAHHTTIHGILTSGESVTLWDPFDQPAIHETRRSQSPWMSAHRTFTHAIIGGHLPSRDETIWSEVAVRFGGMKEWSRVLEPVPAGTDVAELPTYPTAEILDPDGSGINVTITLEDPQRVETDEEWPLGVIRDHTGENAQFRLVFSRPAPVQLAEQVLADLQAFMAFAFQSSAVYSTERAKVQPDDDWLRIHTHHPTDKGSRVTHQWHRMLLRADDFDPSVVLPNWYRLLDEIFPVLQVLAMRLNIQSRVVESSASSALAAAERLHEYVGTTKERFDSELLKRNKALILGAVPGDGNKPFRVFLREVTQVVRPTLQTKLEELFDRMDADAAAELGIDRTGWIAAAKRVRNPLAHTGAHVTQRDGDARQSLDYVEGHTRAILSIVVLGLLGVTPEAIKRAATVLKTEMAVWNNY
ncbi:MAG TPA: HEPN domain-containing protein [Galbitalea sp.]|nr:HEPN domain-containing protein [Galbitalea sp.]